MSREIKFRVWDSGLKKFYNSSNRNIDFLKTYLDYVDQSDHGAASFSVIESGIILQQCTGLLDENGKEVYEGDILENMENFYEVFFENGSFQKKLIKETMSGWKYDTSGNLFGADKIIGNIFENLELLK